MEVNERKKLEALGNPYVLEVVDTYVNLCKPASVRVLTDSKEDTEYVRTRALQLGEEKPLALKGHTVHFDSIHDQGRDSKNTRVLLPKGKIMSKSILTVDKEEGLGEIMQSLDGIMAGREMLISFFCLGPEHSKFSIPALQITDSAYVTHSESILYRFGYDQFKRLKGSKEFFYFIHASGELDERGNSKNVNKRRIYIDLEGERVFTINNQYAGNSVGLKKLALRLAISKANNEDWLCEHMFLMGVHNNGRTTYFTGAFPSACGKTSTAMIPGQTIIGDDIAYLRPGENGIAYGVNVEQGIFGIAQDVNVIDDPVIYKALTTPRELIFSNVLVVDGKPHWLGMGQELPVKGENFSGTWHKGKLGPDGKEILPAHKNARYTMRITELDNADPHLNDPKGVPVSGFIYGGRDSDTSPPVIESLSWSHGVFMAAALESEVGFAKLAGEGDRMHDPMANMDFLVVPLGVYIKNHLAFGKRLGKPPRIFATNYFLKRDGKFVNAKTDKKIWLLWMEGRIHGEYGAIETPIGFIPMYDDLKKLFKDIFNKDFTKEEYEYAFSIRIAKILDGLKRIEKIYAEEHDIPELFHEHLKQQRQRLLEAQKKHGDIISPFKLQ
ncbi:phosphoenolpyruvate carboxykinase (GTP) [Candidatus Woesearchaeota archaeon]|nr:phosphoenolpyruvate carboxykinase (GTP) [Candidatus Woesearchaeota archaeon]